MYPTQYFIIFFRYFIHIQVADYPKLKEEIEFSVKEHIQEQEEKTKVFLHYFMYYLNEDVFCCISF